MYNVKGINKFNIIFPCSTFTFIYFTCLFLALVLKSDLLQKVAIHEYFNHFNDVMLFDVWCRFVGRLFDRGLTTFQMPWQYDYFGNPTLRQSVKKLANEIGPSCQGLRKLKGRLTDLQGIFISFTFKYEVEIRSFETVFFRALPQWTNLQVIQIDECDVEVLEQLALHAINLV